MGVPVLRALLSTAEGRVAIKYAANAKERRESSASPRRGGPLRHRHGGPHRTVGRGATRRAGPDALRRTVADAAGAAEMLGGPRAKKVGKQLAVGGIGLLVVVWAARLLLGWL